MLRKGLILPHSATECVCARQKGGKEASFYAEGVIFHSPGSAQRRSREAPPWVTKVMKTNTPKALHNDPRDDQ